MGREIVYCEGCGERLTQDDFDRGKAQDHEGRPFCAKCRPVTEEPSPQPPPPDRRSTERRSGGSSSRRRGATERIPRADAPPSTRRRPSEGQGNNTALIAGGVAAALAFVIVVGIAIGGSKPPAPDAVIAPEVDRSVERLREQAALELKKEKERAAELERVRAEEAAKKRAAEEREAKAAAEREAKAAAEREAAERKAAEEKKAAEKAPPKSWSDLFLLATNQIQANDYPGAKKIYLEGLPTAPATRPEDIRLRAIYCIGLYNLACIYAVESPKLAEPARAQAVTEALKYLDWALRSDYGKFKCACHPQTFGIGHMGDDKDMDPLRNDPRYADLLKKYK